MTATWVFQSAGTNAVYNERVAIMLGLFTLVFAVLAFASCRTCLTWLTRLGMSDPLDNRVYRQFYRFHGYYWWFLGIALVAHVFMAIVHTGLPQAGDPDAYVHWRILGFGLGGAAAMLTVFGSCRLCLKYFSRSLKPISSAAGGFRSFNRFHTYYWLMFLIIAALHFFLAFNHAGVWPAG